MSSHDAVDPFDPSTIPWPQDAAGWTIFVLILAAMLAIWIGLTVWFVRDLRRRYGPSPAPLALWITIYVVVSLPVLIVWLFVRPKLRDVPSTSH